VTLHKYYTTLKRQPDLKKRVTWFSNPGNQDLSTRAIVEYIGVVKQLESSHGNSKKDNGPYKRTHPDVLQHAAQELKTKKPRQVYKEMVLKDEENAPRDLQQLRDLKYRTECKSATSNGNNVADDILNVLSMVKDHPFIQKVEQSKNNVPSIILYSYEQMTDFKKFIGTSKERILDISVPGHFGTDLDISVLDISVLTWTSRYWTVRDLDETIFGTDHNCLVLINWQYFCTSSSLIYDPKVDRYVFLIIPV
jgi:hypothetical protein